MVDCGWSYQNITNTLCNYTPISLTEYAEYVEQEQTIVLPQDGGQQPGLEIVSESESIYEEPIGNPNQVKYGFQMLV